MRLVSFGGLTGNSSSNMQQHIFGEHCFTQSIYIFSYFQYRHVLDSRAFTIYFRAAAIKWLLQRGCGLLKGCILWPLTEECTAYYSVMSAMPSFVWSFGCRVKAVGEGDSIPSYMQSHTHRREEERDRNGHH